MSSSDSQPSASVAHSVHPVSDLEHSCANIQILVPCAGIGSRAGAKNRADKDIPKQYALLASRPLVQHTLEALLQVKGVQKVWLVLAEADEYFADLAIHDARLHVLPCGGETRAHSVANGLKAMQKMGVAEDDWVLVHDAARCLVKPGWIRSLINEVKAKACDGGLLALPLPDTLKQADEKQQVANTLPRADKWLAQTPQMFRLHPLLNALEQPNAAFTDEASAMEKMGIKPILVRGHSHNFKVTYPEDFALAEAILQSRKVDD